jgi:NLR family CARD domain-containing protein 3
LRSLSYNRLGAEGAAALAPALAANGALTSLELRGNWLGDKGWGTIFAAICGNKDSKIMSLDARASENIGPAGVKLIAEALRTSVTGGLTSLDLSNNLLCGVTTFSGGTYTAEGITAIAEALRVNGGLTSIDLSLNQLCGIWTDGYGNPQGTYTAEGIAAIADALRVNGVLTALNLSSNSLKDEGVNAVCEAIQSNKETKLASLNFSDNSIGPVGANAVAAMVAVTGALTKIDVSWNSFGPEGAKVFADALRVNGALTSIDLSENKLCGVWADDDYEYGNYTAEGITAIADALRVNGALTKIE